MRLRVSFRRVSAGMSLFNTTGRERKLSKTMKPQKFRKLWTTGQIATLIGSPSPKAVVKWIEDGDLLVVDLPGVRERRVHHRDLRDFLVRRGLHWALQEFDAIMAGKGEEYHLSEMAPPSPPPLPKSNGPPPPLTRNRRSRPPTDSST